MSKDYDVQFAFRDDIVDQIDMVDNGQSYVDYDTLEIDAPKNFLKYEDSVIVNISAKSLQDLSIKRRNGLLGMNLRYYVKKKEDKSKKAEKRKTKDKKTSTTKNSSKKEKSTKKRRSK